MTQRKPYQTYPKAFKLEALSLMESSDLIKRVSVD